MSKAGQSQQDSDGEDGDFVDARESWHEPIPSNKEEEKTKCVNLPKPTTTPARSLAPCFIPIPHQILAKGTLAPPNYWSDPPKIIQHSPYKQYASKGKQKAVTPFVSKGASTIPSDHAAPASIDGFPELSSVMGYLPPPPIQKPKVEAYTTPKPRNRLPPIARITTQKSVKNTLEFNGICLQQELRGGTQSIWVARFSTDGAFFATSGEDHVVRIWEVGDYSQQCNFSYCLTLINSC